MVKELIAERPAGTPDVQSIRDFSKLWCEIKEIKEQLAVKRIEPAIADLAEMKRQDSDEYQRLATKLRKILGDQPGANGGESSQPDAKPGTNEG